MLTCQCVAAMDTLYPGAERVLCATRCGYQAHKFCFLAVTVPCCGRWGHGNDDRHRTMLVS